MGIITISSCRHLIQILKRLPFCQHSNKHLCFIRDIILYFLTALMKSTDGSLIDIAVKAPILCLLTRGAVVDFYEEAKTTISLDHPNVVKCLGFSKEPNELPSLLFEFMDFGSLENILAFNRTKNLKNSRAPKLKNVNSLQLFCYFFKFQILK